MGITIDGYKFAKAWGIDPNVLREKATALGVDAKGNVVHRIPLRDLVLAIPYNRLESDHHANR
jgi:hypothetical protein